MTDPDPSAPDLSGRIALVTGASRGIGREAALALAKAGAHVIALARTVGGLEELDDEIFAATGAHATLIPVNLTEPEAVERLGGAIASRFGRLDIFVANAGILGELGPLPHMDPKIWDHVIATNLTANWRLIRSLDPLLRASDAGRAIFLSSGASRRIRAYWGPYAVSKAGLDALARTYAAEMENTNVRVALVNPGKTRTRMRAQAMPGEDPQTVPPADHVAPVIVALAAPAFDDNGADIYVPEWRAQNGLPTA